MSNSSDPPETDDGTPEKHDGTPFGKVSKQPWLAQPPKSVSAIVGMTVTVFFRQDFGERYLNPLAMVKGTLFLALYLVAMRLYAGAGNYNIRQPVPISGWMSWLLYTALFYSYGSWQLFRAVRRKDLFPDEYSLSDGRPHQFLTRFMPFMRDAWDFERFYEPLITVACGFCLTCFHNWMGPYLFAAGFAAFFTARRKHEAERAMDLDKSDGIMSANPDVKPPSTQHVIRSFSNRK